MLCCKKYCSSLLLVFFIWFSNAQETKTALDADQFIGIDNLDNIFYIKDNILFKKGGKWHV